MGKSTYNFKQKVERELKEWHTFLITMKIQNLVAQQLNQRNR